MYTARFKGNNIITSTYAQLNCLLANWQSNITLEKEINITIKTSKLDSNYIDI